MPSARELIRKRDALQGLEGWRILRALKAVERSRGIFLGNERELETFLASYSEDSSVASFWVVTPSPELERFLDETDRLLHNFVAAAESLRVHAEKVAGEYLADDDAWRDVERGVFNSPVAKFVHELRHHTAHDRIPRTLGYARMGTEPQEFAAGVALDAETLRRFRRTEWSRKASRYMDQSDGNPLIATVVADYRAVIQGFYESLDTTVRAHHQTALRELGAAVIEYNAEVSAFTEGEQNQPPM